MAHNSAQGELLVRLGQAQGPVWGGRLGGFTAGFTASGVAEALWDLSGMPFAPP